MWHDFICRIYSGADIVGQEIWTQGAKGCWRFFFYLIEPSNDPW